MLAKTKPDRERTATLRPWPRAPAVFMKPGVLNALALTEVVVVLEEFDRAWDPARSAQKRLLSPRR